MLEMCSFLGICTLRLDFDTFVLRGVADNVESAGGACVDDVLDITVSF